MKTKQKTLFGGVREADPFRPIETGNKSSDAAAERVRIRAKGHAAMIYAAVRCAEPRGLTAAEIEAATGIVGDSHRPRILKLIDLGYLRLQLGPGPEFDPIERDGRQIYFVTEKPWPHNQAADGSIR